MMERGRASDLWRVVRESAEKRLGRELLWAYVILLAAGVIAVGGSVLFAAVQ